MRTCWSQVVGIHSLDITRWKIVQISQILSFRVNTSPLNSWLGFLTCLKCQGLGFVFLLAWSLQSSCIILYLYALLWPLSDDPIFSHATIGRLSTMSVHYWSNYFLAITFSKYIKTIRKQSQTPAIFVINACKDIWSHTVVLVLASLFSNTIAL